MKYSVSNPPLQCFMNQSTWLKGALANGTPVGVLWHDTAAGNPYIHRYVQPDDTAPDRKKLLNILGTNKYNNDWNHIEYQSGVNLFIGKFADGSISTVQVGPLTTHPWGCGKGVKGSCNGYTVSNGTSYWSDKFWIQFEICDDGYGTNKGTKDYFLKTYQEACEITAYLCKLFDIDPFGFVDFAGMKVPTLLCHQDSHKLQLGSDHSDVLRWFGLYGYTMENVRNDVKKLLSDEAKDQVPEENVYRIRKSWKDSASQVGVYIELSQAIINCDKAGEGYSVFNSKGKCMYTAPDGPSKDEEVLLPEDIEPVASKQKPTVVQTETTSAPPTEENTQDAMVAPVQEDPVQQEIPTQTFSPIKRFLISLLTALRKIFTK